MDYFITFLQGLGIVFASFAVAFTLFVICAAVLLRTVRSLEVGDKGDRRGRKR